MGKVLIEEENLTNIANSIRSKTGSSELMTPGEMSGNIETIDGVSDYFKDTISGTTSSSGGTFSQTILKLPAFKNEGTSCGYLFNGLTNLKEVDLRNFNTENVTYMENMFSGCKSLENIDLSNIVTDNVTSMRYLFNNCESLKELNVNHFNTLNANDYTSVFASCKSLTSLDISNWDSLKPSTFQGTFSNCTNLETLDISGFSHDPNKTISFNLTFQNCSKLKTVNWGNLFSYRGLAFGSTFHGCSSLETLPPINMESATRVDNIVYGCTALKNLSGFINLGKAYTKTTVNYQQCTLNLATCTALTHDSLMNVINNLYDLNLSYDVANGGTLYTQSLVLGATNLAKLTDEEIAIATAKGWTVS